MIQIYQIKPVHKSKNRKRVGRGGKKGTYCGRGMKGQKSRAGRKMVPIIRGIIKRYPKLRGYRFGSLKKNKNEVIVNFNVLNENFKEGEIVSPQVLIKKGIICKIKARTPKVKILAKGDLSKKLIIKGCNLSKQAKEKIKKIGGTVRE